ncbi:MAG: class I SAM-dependent methyltransferase [Flavobacteriales bacterium]|nr:class I SAM-dependent methyltransferase [Flavobacteriales bacterium]MCW8937709.1 class I SAM-dependent methyltransferase [Flavobacteriales bacterium]MCW8968574.1 class I SAM-dependent methyltransferase [Flavobacteriales bacterium]MCW8990197.1 class I SAM-dependent methyltransferase [Flavobacteriales bacterium]MCW9019915.1 class I SAM-dependent methyltransferase [Flavobacteriales bacterium]
MNNNILKQVNDYYSDKITQNGATPEGVDWNSTESQYLRFKVLSNIIDKDENFTVLDYGCGFGSMYDFLKKSYTNFNYTGYDISQKMIDAALEFYPNDNNSNWLNSLNNSKKYDYTIASGIFNVRLKNSDEKWLNYITETLHKIDNLSKMGFAFNILTKYSDKEYMRDYLYYADPLFLFDYCKKHFSKNVALLHDYNLYEFTIIVRKNG